MNSETLFTMQKGLDSHIEAQHKLADEDLFDKKVLALLVELGELANETRCFKFWSLKPASEKAVIVEEFVDGIHFILSLGIECGFEDTLIKSSGMKEQLDASSQFLNVYESILKFSHSRTKEDYENVLESYLLLAEILGLTEAEIEQAYIEKNEVNYERQRKGY